MSYKNIFKINDRIINSDKQNDYRLIKRLGNGGSGDAYICMCVNGINSGCYFVIKFFYKVEMEDRLKRFNKEIEFLENADHPAIVKLYDKGNHNYYDSEKKEMIMFPYYIMEYMPNNLKSELAKGRLSIEKAFLYSTQLLSALCYIKEKGKLHRDIKPENIFINGSNAILGDFGLIKDISDKSAIKSDIESVEESIFSSISNGDAMPLQHRSPHLVEYLVEKKPLTFNSDTFQMGLVLFMMFIGENPLKPLNSREQIGSPVEFKKPIHMFFDDIKKMKIIDKDGQGKLVEKDLGQYIINILTSMVNLDDSKIKDCNKLLELCMLNYMNYLKKRSDLDGDIF